MNASLNYGNMSKIFQEINRNQASGKYGGARIRFSTLAEYADHVHSLNLSYPVHRWPEVSLLLPGVCTCEGRVLPAESAAASDSFTEAH